jgi:hypothetical protein
MGDESIPYRQSADPKPWELVTFEQGQQMMRAQINWYQRTQLDRVPGSEFNFDPTQVNLVLTSVESLVRDLERDGILSVKSLGSPLDLEASAGSVESDVRPIVIRFG